MKAERDLAFELLKDRELQSGKGFNIPLPAGWGSVGPRADGVS